MRFVPALLMAFVLALSACKDDIEEIGKFTVELNGDSIEFTSVFDITNDHSSIRQMSPAGVKLLLIDGFADIKDGEPGFPIISMSLQSGIAGGPMSLLFVQVYDESYENNLTADGPLGQKRLDNFEMGADGSISFDFSADLVRVTTQSEEPIAGAQGAHIVGRFSGKMPASEMEE